LHKCIANGFDKAIPFRNAGNPGNADPDFPLHKRSFMQLSFAPRMTTLTKRIRQNSLKMTQKGVMNLSDYEFGLFAHL
jgi:hypothetical protein